MTNKKISEMDVVSPLTGDELVEVVTGDDNLRTTTQAIADLASGGGGPAPFDVFSNKYDYDILNNTVEYVSETALGEDEVIRISSILELEVESGSELYQLDISLLIDGVAIATVLFPRSSAGAFTGVAYLEVKATILAFDVDLQRTYMSVDATLVPESDPYETSRNASYGTSSEDTTGGFTLELQVTNQEGATGAEVRHRMTVIERMTSSALLTPT